MKKIVVVFSSGEPEKIKTGLMFTRNAMLHRWFDDVKCFIFGPSQKLVTENRELSSMFKELIDGGTVPTACKYIADSQDIQEPLAGIGFEIDYVGRPISDYINKDYIPMVF